MLTLSFLKVLAVCGILSGAFGATMPPQIVDLCISVIFSAAIGAGLVLIYQEFVMAMAPRPAPAWG